MPNLDMESHQEPGIESPQEIYSRALQQNREKLSIQKRWDRSLGIAKLILGLIAVILLVRFVHELHGARLLLIPVVLIVVLAVLHERVLSRIRVIKAHMAFYERGLARLEDRWAGTGETGERFVQDAHPYARDLDLFGKGSLFELLSIFRTRAGEEMLARWLLEPAPPAEVHIRQQAVRELKSRNGFRETLFTAGEDIRVGVHPETLVVWGERKPAPVLPSAALIMLALLVLWVASIAYAIASGLYWPALLISALNVFVNGHFRKPLDMFVETAEAAGADLKLLAQVLRIVETEHFSTPRLVNLQTTLQSDGVSASAAVKRLDRIVRFLEHHRNLIVRSLDPFIFFTVQCTLRAEAWRKEFGPAIRRWLAGVGEVEALTALSCFAFEHPADAWPEISDGPAWFAAESLAHPLLPDSKAVRNDVELGGDLQLIVLSGPNMSGKSTFVRGIGINAVLAQCGAPVRAGRLRMSSLAIGASICVLDSLQGGISRFYAEIKRLKAIADLAKEARPVLFLLDELLSGTNSHDRREGTELVVRALMQRNAIGIVTTHDLALARIPDTMNGSARNYHFEDHLEDGKLVFDFKLRPGVVQTSNALKLMESIGLLPEQPSPRKG